MNFLEKNLEDIIWENYERCAERGLDIAQHFFKDGKLFRQLNLAPYGIADMVCVRYSPGGKSYYVQVIELKRGKVDVAAFMQAKRYQTALSKVILPMMEGIDRQTNVYIESVLVGDSIDESGDFTFVLNSDFACSAFTYSYGFDGIKFTRDNRDWIMKGTRESSALEALRSTLLKDAKAAERIYHASVIEGAEERNAQEQLTGDPTEALLVTPEGILLNMALLNVDGVESALAWELRHWTAEGFISDEDLEEGGYDGDE